MDPVSPDPAYARLRAQFETVPVIEQAKGIVIAQQGCGPAEAFEVLRRASQRANVKVAVLAALLVQQTAGTAAADTAGRPARPAARQTELTVDGMAAALRLAHGPDVTSQAGAAPLGGRSPGPAYDSRCGGEVVPPGPAIITMPGEVTYLNAEQIRSELAAALVADTTAAVVVDFTHTGFCDSAGVRELVIAHKQATTSKVTFGVAVPPGHLRDFLARTGLVAYLPLYPSLAEAVAAAPQPAQ